MTSNSLPILSRVGVVISPEAMAIARGDQILADFVDRVARPSWCQEIRRRGAQTRIADAIELLSDQIAHYNLDRDSALEAALTARRYAHYLLRDLSSYEAIARDVSANWKLPPAFPGPTDELEQFAESTCKQFLSSLLALIEGQPVHRGPSGSSPRYSREEPDAPFERWDDRARGRQWDTTAYSCHDVLRPIAMKLLRAGLAEDDGGQFEAAHLLLDQLQICYGFGAADALEILINPTGIEPEISPHFPGWIDRQSGELVRVIGNGFFRGGLRYDQGTYRLRLLPHVRRLLDQCVPKSHEGPLRLALGDDNFYDSYRRRTRRIISDWQPRMGFRGKNLHASFEAAALYACRIFSSELSIFRGKSVYGSDSEANYISLSAAEIEAKWALVYRQLHFWATNSEPSVELLGSRPQTNRLGRLDALSFSEVVRLVRDRIAAAGSWNELVVCCEALLQALGGRNRVHRNPASLYRAFPCAHLQLADKHRDSELIGIREVPVVGPVRDLVEFAVDVVGVDGDFLPYLEGGTVVSSSEVTNRSLFAWLSAGRVSSLGRTALYNELRTRGVGDVIRSYLLGHGDREVLRSLSLPVSGSRLFAEASAVLEVILQESDYGQAVAELRAAAQRFDRPKRSKSWLRNNDGALEVLSVASDRPTPLTQFEDRCASWIYDGLQNELRLSAEPWASAALLSLEAGIPFRFLVANHSYFNFGSIAFPEGQDEALLVALIEHADVGHLSPFLYRLPKECASLEQIRRRFNNRCSDRRKAPTQFLRYSLFGDPKDVPKAIARFLNCLLLRGNAPRDHANLSGREAVELLDRISSRLAIHLHPKSVTAGFRGSVPGMNHIEIESVVSEIYGQNCHLKNLCGEHWEPWIPCSYRRKISRAVPASFKKWIESQRVALNDPWLTAVHQGNHPVQRLHDLFVHHRFDPGIGRFVLVLKLLGFGKTERRNLAYAAYRMFRARGNLSLSAPERIIDACSPGWHQRVENSSARIRPVKAEYDETQKRTREHMTVSVLSAQRISEVVALEPYELNNGSYGGWIYVYDGKTDSARRAICLEHLGTSDPNLAITDHRRVEWIASEAPKTTTKRLSRAIKRAFDINPHGLRRSAAWRALRFHHANLISSGNLLETLAVLARCFGHRSIITYLHSYVGTMLAALSERGLNARNLVLKPLPTRRIVSGRDALRELYSGRTHARHVIRMVLKRLRAEPSGGTLMGRCWVGSRSRLAAHATWCDQQLAVPVWVGELPGFPQLPEFWDALAKIREVAETRHLPVLIVVPQNVLRDKHDRFVAILGAEALAGPFENPPPPLRI